MPTNLNAMSFGGFGNFGGFGGYGDFANSVSTMAFKVLMDDASQLNSPTRERRATASVSALVLPPGLNARRKNTTTARMKQKWFITRGTIVFVAPVYSRRGALGGPYGPG